MLDAFILAETHDLVYMMEPVGLPDPQQARQQQLEELRQQQLEELQQQQLRGLRKQQLQRLQQQQQPHTRGRRNGARGRAGRFGGK